MVYMKNKDRLLYLGWMSSKPKTSLLDSYWSIKWIWLKSKEGPFCWTYLMPRFISKSDSTRGQNLLTFDTFCGNFVLKTGDAVNIFIIGNYEGLGSNLKDKWNYEMEFYTNFFSWSSFSAIDIGSISSFPMSTITGAFLLIWRALVPMSLAFSYLVMKSGQILSDLGLSYSPSCFSMISIFSNFSSASLY